MKLNFSNSVIIASVLIIAIGLGVKIFNDKVPSEYDSFAQCLTQNGAKMYGTDWCQHCKKQKEMFGNAFKYIDFVNCDTQKDICTSEKVEGFPTWKDHSKNPSIVTFTGTTPLSKLAESYKCELPKK